MRRVHQENKSCSQNSVSVQTEQQQQQQKIAERLKKALGIQIEEQPVMPDENMPLQKFKPNFKYNQNNKIQILIIVCY